jgi:hypothetical protein
MNDQDPTSGNRWEPRPDESTIADDPTVEHPTVEASPSHQPPPAIGRRQRLATAMRRPRAIVGTAAAVVALAGVGGFGIGRATAGDTVVPASAGFDAGQQPGTTDGYGQAPDGGFDSDGGQGHRGPPGMTGTRPDGTPPGQTEPDSDGDATDGDTGTSGNSSTT